MTSAIWYDFQFFTGGFLFFIANWALISGGLWICVKGASILVDKNISIWLMLVCMSGCVIIFMSLAPELIHRKLTPYHLIYEPFFDWQLEIVGKAKDVRNDE